jgi:hypothetical protein
MAGTPHSKTHILERMQTLPKIILPFSANIKKKREREPVQQKKTKGRRDSI